jgi:transcriptional regulator with GAF, ATPase, and Fis domain
VAHGGAEAFSKLDQGNWQLLVLDRDLPDLNAQELLEMTNRLYPGIQVLVVEPERTDCGTVENSRSDTRSTSVAEPSTRVIQSQPGAHAAQEKNKPLPGMVGTSEAMRQVYQMVRLVARHNTTVLIQGASGSGKELVARAIHRLSSRPNPSFSVLNCAAIPETLIESELFGYARGAFTGAVQTYGGRILAAQGGTLFLDEIGELPLSAQAKLLRFLEQKEVQRLGSAETCRVDVRVVAATNRKLAELVERGQFREDLFFRLSAFPIEIPPLAERRGDISLLAGQFLEGLAGGQRLQLDPRSQQMLESYFWPGNVRELQQVLERAAILAEDGAMIFPEHLRFNFERSPRILGRIAC